MPRLLHDGVRDEQDDKRLRQTLWTWHFDSASMATNVHKSQRLAAELYFECFDLLLILGGASCGCMLLCPINVSVAPLPPSNSQISVLQWYAEGNEPLYNGTTEVSFFARFHPCPAKSRPCADCVAPTVFHGFGLRFRSGRHSPRRTRRREASSTVIATAVLPFRAWRAWA